MTSGLSSEPQIALTMPLSCAFLSHRASAARLAASLRSCLERESARAFPPFDAPSLASSRPARLDFLVISTILHCVHVYAMVQSDSHPGKHPGHKKPVVAWRLRGVRDPHLVLEDYFSPPERRLIVPLRPGLLSALRSYAVVTTRLDLAADFIDFLRRGVRAGW